MLLFVSLYQSIGLSLRKWLHCCQVTIFSIKLSCKTIGWLKLGALNLMSFVCLFLTKANDLSKLIWTIDHIIFFILFLLHFIWFILGPSLIVQFISFFSNIAHQSVILRSDYHPKSSRIFRCGIILLKVVQIFDFILFLVNTMFQTIIFMAFFRFTVCLFFSDISISII